MATGGLGMGTAPAPAPNNLLEQKLRAEAVVKAAAGWFLWVAALSVVNSFLSMSGSGIRFIFGLGIAQIIDALAHQAGSSGVVLDLIINGFVAGVLLLFWNFARKGEKWAFIVGMALYAGRWFNSAFSEGRSRHGFSCLCSLPNVSRNSSYSGAAAHRAGDGACWRADRAQINNQICLLRSRSNRSL